MRHLWMALVVVAGLASPATAADPDIPAEMQKDVVLRALVDELERGQARLKLQDLERPYFIEYLLTDTDRASISAELGAVTTRNENPGRTLRSGVRVGSYELDNTNFQSGGYGGFYGLDFGGLPAADIPTEDDYAAIRQAIWWATDQDYKHVVETLVQKRAFMESKLIQDKPDDFSRETPTVYFADRTSVAIDLPALEELVVTLSAMFREYPGIQDSSASVCAYAGNKYLVNTEGTRLRTACTRLSLSVTATVQAEDGMKLSDALSVHARKLEALPAREELLRRCRTMAERLIALKDAPTVAAYTGPVLVDAEAAATLFARQFATAFAGGQRPVGTRATPDDFANKLNKRILPRFLNVVDDPTQDVIAGIPVMGHYRFDSQGVPAQPVRLVKAGRLTGLLMSRNPSKDFKQSNGHGRGAYGTPRATVACLIVAADPADDAPTLKRKLLSACEDEDLEFGLRLARLGNTGDARSSSAGWSAFGYARRGSAVVNPAVMYKVYPDGREELVRGAEIARLDFKAFKRIRAAGDTPFVLNTGGGAEAQTIVAPALLFEELDLAKVDRDFDKPPILPSPLAR
jgi:TldD protein